MCLEYSITVFFRAMVFFSKVFFSMVFFSMVFFYVCIIFYEPPDPVAEYPA